MTDDAAEAWNALEILLEECTRRLDSENWRKQFSPRLFEKVETLASRARINSPARFHQSPFNSEIVVSLWCPWTIECMFVGTQAQFCYESIKTTLEQWIRWKHFYDAGGESDLLIRNRDLWPPSGIDWEERTAIRESECQALLDSRDSKGLSSLFSVSPRAFVFALGVWVKLFDSVFEAGPDRSYRFHALRNEMPEVALAEVRDVLSLISEAHANVERESDVAKFNRGSITWLEDKLGAMLRFNCRVLHFDDAYCPSQYPFIVSGCLDFENTLMRRWLTELAHSTDHIPADQIPPLNDGRRRELDTAAQSETVSVQPMAAANDPKADETTPDEGHNNQVKTTTHSVHFDSVSWHGTPYRFTSKQAAVVKVLWEAWIAGKPSVLAVELLDAAQSDGKRVRDIFKSGKGAHPAWGTMIIRDGKSHYKLSDPKISEPQ